LNDKFGKSAGNIDIVLVSYDELGRLKDFGSLEVQAVYTSGTISAPFKQYIADPAKNVNLDWRRHKNYPRPDFLSSSRKRLAPQLIYKAESSMLGKRKWLWL
jgi:restriction endonuclease NotI